MVSHDFGSFIKYFDHFQNVLLLPYIIVRRLNQFISDILTLLSLHLTLLFIIILLLPCSLLQFNGSSFSHACSRLISSHTTLGTLCANF